MKKPIIGITPLYDEKKESYWMLPGYMKGIQAAGGIPVMLPLTTDIDVITSMVHTFDGFLFAGGQDINPEMYGETKEAYCGSQCYERDKMEEMLFKGVLELDKPAFGICRGLQLFNVLLGGTLYQDIIAQRNGDGQIEHKQKPPYNRTTHNVMIKRDTMLYDILGKNKIAVNSYHHQGIKQLTKHLQCVARAEDGMVESVIMPNKKFIWAVQWHPEFLYNTNEDSLKLFRAFVKACK